MRRIRLKKPFKIIDGWKVPTQLAGVVDPDLYRVKESLKARLKNAIKKANITPLEDEEYPYHILYHIVALDIDKEWDISKVKYQVPKDYDNMALIILFKLLPDILQGDKFNEKYRFFHHSGKPYVKEDDMNHHQSSIILGSKTDSKKELRADIFIFGDNEVEEMFNVFKNIKNDKNYYLLDGNDTDNKEGIPKFPRLFDD